VRLRKMARAPCVCVCQRPSHILWLTLLYVHRHEQTRRHAHTCIPKWIHVCIPIYIPKCLPASCHAVLPWQVSKMHISVQGTYTHAQQHTCVCMTTYMYMYIYIYIYI
jgi:hypothetical protein